MLIVPANLAAAFLFGAILLLTGSRMSRLLRLPIPAGESPAVMFSLGSALTGAWILLLGLLGLFQPYLLAGGLVLQALFLLLLPGGRLRWRRPHPLTLTALLAALPNLPVALGPPYFYDAMVYHLGLPWQMLQEHAITAHPEDLFSSFPPLGQLLYAPLLAVHAFRAPGILHLFAWGCAAVAAGSMSRRLGAGKSAAHLVTAAAMLLPQTPLVPAFPAAEGFFLAALLPACSLLLHARTPGLPHPVADARYRLAFLLAGIACAHRLQALSWVVLLLGLALIRSRSFQILLDAAVWGLAGSLSWWLKNLLLLHDPLAPVFWNRPGMEALWRAGGAWLRAGLSPAEMFARLPVILGPMMPALLPLLFAGAMAALFQRRSRGICMLAAVGLLFWPLTGALPRFFAPTAMLWLVTAASWKRPAPGRITAFIVLLPGLILGLSAQLHLIRITDAPALFPLDYREAAEYVSPNPPFGAYSELAARLPSDSRVLLLCESRGFGFPRPFLSPSQVDPSPLRKLVETGLPPGEIRRQLRKEGLTHILLNLGELRRLEKDYPVTPWESPEGEGRFWAFIQTLGPPLLSRGPIRVWALRKAPASSDPESPAPDTMSSPQ